MSGEEVLRLVREYMKTIEDSRIYFTLRKMKLKHFGEGTIRAVKVFLALHHFQLDIVGTNLFGELYGTSSAATLAQLHRLGDKGVLTLVRGGKFGQLRYMLSRKFLEHFTASSEQIDLNNGSQIG